MKFNKLIQKNFTSNITQNLKQPLNTSFYLWLSNVSPGMRSDDYKNRVSVSTSPKKLEFFENKNPKYAYLGPRHTGVITENGDLYTFGSGNWGILGHGSEDNVKFNEPKLVEYFKNKNKKVKKVVLGDYHSIALTEDGNVYSWGYGGNKGYLRFFRRDPGSLGHGDWKHYFTPKKISFFEKNSLKIKDIACGKRHSVVLTECNKIYTFGFGECGLLGNGSNTNSEIPIFNEYIDMYLKEKADDTKIIKIDCADEYTGLLTNKGDLYVWGKNNSGQLGIGTGIGIDMLESEKFPTLIHKDDPNTIIKDFNCGENAMMFIDDKGVLYKTGWSINYTAARMEQSLELKPKRFFCGNSFYCMIDSKDDIYQWGNLFKSKVVNNKTDNELRKIEKDIFEGNEVLDINGKFKMCGAIVQKAAIKEEETSSKI